MDSPLSPLSPREGLDDFDLRGLSQTTLKSFERLTPWVHLRTSAHGAVPIVSKIVEKMNAYIRALDLSMVAVQLSYRLADDALAYCNLPADDSAPNKRQETLKRLVVIADEGYNSSAGANTTFKEVQQDLYKIAAETKDNNSITHVPVDPGQLPTLEKALKEVGSDLVTNAKLLAEFSSHISDFTLWWTWIKRELSVGRQSSSTILSFDGADPSRNLTLSSQWEKVKQGCLTYYDDLKDTQEAFPNLLPNSLSAWKKAVSPPGAGNSAALNGEKQKNMHTAAEKVKKIMIFLVEIKNKARGGGTGDGAQNNVSIQEPSSQGKNSKTGMVTVTDDLGKKPQTSGVAAKLLRLLTCGTVGTNSSTAAPQPV